MTLSRDEDIKTLVLTVASLWSEQFKLRYRYTELIRSEDAVEMAQRAVEAQGVLYNYRAVLQEALDDETYDQLAEAALFPMIEDALAQAEGDPVKAASIMYLKIFSQDPPSTA